MPGPASHVIQQPQAAIGQQPLGRDVDEVDLAGAHAPLDRSRVGRGQGRIERRRAHAEFVERGDLVRHQRDQRRDDDTDARPQQRRDLVGERLAAAGRHQHQRVAAGGDMLDHLALEATKAVVAENVLEQGLGLDRSTAVA